MAKFTRRQRRIILVGTVLIGISLVFPCWQIVIYSSQGGGVIAYDSYAPIFSPPHSRDSYAWTVDLDRLIVQIGIIMVIVFGLVIATPKELGPELASRESQ